MYFFLPSLNLPPFLYSPLRKVLFHTVWFLRSYYDSESRQQVEKMRTRELRGKKQEFRLVLSVSGLNFIVENQSMGKEKRKVRKEARKTVCPSNEELGRADENNKETFRLGYQMKS